MDYRRLKGRIVEIFGTQSEFAVFLGITEQTVSNKLSGRSDFTRADILLWANALQIDTAHIAYYFF